MTRRESLDPPRASERIYEKFILPNTRAHCDPILLDGPMERPAVLGVEPSGFFDPLEATSAVRVELEQIAEGHDNFRLLRPVGYWDTGLGGIIVPENMERFTTDLTSVPSLFSWLVARTGPHLPAALIHDGLVDGNSSYVVHDPEIHPPESVPRTTADRIFRSALRDLGISPLRRWLMWTAVATDTKWQGAEGAGGPSKLKTLIGRVAVLLTVTSVVVMGALSTVDLLDWRNWLWWMGNRPTWQELVGGAVAALIIPAFVALAWLRQYKAGLIAGIALAFLVHVTVALFFVSSLYLSAEAVSQGRTGPAVKWFLAAVVVGTAVIGFGVWAYSGRPGAS